MLNSNPDSKYALTLAYDGGEFYGWKASQNVPSIFSALQHVLETLLQHPVQLEGASRTDRGVHAVGQVATFSSPKPVELRRFLLGCNALLPPSIRLLKVHSVKSSFHPTLDALYKEYRYFICNQPFQLPPFRHFSWHQPVALNLPLMQAAAAQLVGKHDFAAFTNRKHNEKYHNTERTLHLFSVESLENDRLMIRLQADAFLYKMARNLVGLLVHVGKEKLAIERVPDLFSPALLRSWMTAPAHGLFLHKITYPDTLIV